MAEVCTYEIIWCQSKMERSAGANPWRPILSVAALGSCVLCSALIPAVGRGVRICYCRSLGTMQAATMGFQASKPLTHLQLEASKSHWLSRCWCTIFPLLRRSVVKSPTHRLDSSPFGSLSKQWMGHEDQVRGAEMERRGGGERREAAACRIFFFFFSPVVSKLLRWVG